MKMLLIVAITLSSQLSFAREVQSEEQKQDIVRAIKESLAVQDLDCIETVTSRTSKASKLNFFILPASKLTINETGQPVLTFKSESETSSYIAKISTNDNFTIVTKIMFKSEKLTKKTTSRNTGTIVKPNYINEVTLTREITQELICE